MNSHNFFKTRIYIVSLVSLAIWSLLAWNYFNGGIPSHHLLAREDLPSFSNAWGALLIPLLTWFLLYRIQLRLDRNRTAQVSSKTIYGFAGALLFGITLAVLFSLRIEHVPGYMVLSLPLLALFIPIYRAEYLLGFVLGMTYTFGAVLPTIIGSVFALIGVVLYFSVRKVVSYFSRKA